METPTLVALIAATATLLPGDASAQSGINSLLRGSELFKTSIIMNSDKEMAVSEFLQELMSDKATPSRFAVTGMVKKSENQEAHDKIPEYISFAPGTSCAEWIQVPVALVEKVVMHGTVPCKDHSHPFVTLQFKPPSTPGAKVFAAMLASMSSQLQQMLRQFRLRACESSFPGGPGVQYYDPLYEDCNCRRLGSWTFCHVTPKFMDVSPRLQFPWWPFPGDAPPSPA